MELGRVVFGGVFKNNLPNNAGGGEGGRIRHNEENGTKKTRLLFSLPWDPFFCQRKKSELVTFYGSEIFVTLLPFFNWPLSL